MNTHKCSVAGLYVYMCIQMDMEWIAMIVIMKIAFKNDSLGHKGIKWINVNFKMNE